MSFIVAQPVRGNLKDLSEYFDKKSKRKTERENKEIKNKERKK